MSQLFNTVELYDVFMLLPKSMSLTLVISGDSSSLCALSNDKLT
jgi:hypothetical protein